MRELVRGSGTEAKREGNWLAKEVGACIDVLHVDQNPGSNLVAIIGGFVFLESVVELAVRSLHHLQMVHNVRFIRDQVHCAAIVVVCDKVSFALGVEFKPVPNYLGTLEEASCLPFP